VLLRNTITDMQIQKFARAGERTWQARYSYDFAQAGLPRLTAGVIYLRGDNIDTVAANGTESGNGRSEWERDLTVGYVVQAGPLKTWALCGKTRLGAMTFRVSVTRMRIG
jgi:hypothetical protein